MPTEEDLLSFGLDTKRVRGSRLPVGRGFTQDSLEFQVAVPVRDGERLGPEEAVRVNSTGAAVIAPRIEILPTLVPRASLDMTTGDGGIPVGLADEDFATASIDLSDTHFLVVGPYKSGRSTALVTLATNIREADPTATFHLLAPRRSVLRDLDFWSSAAASADACVRAATSLVENLRAGVTEGPPVFVFIDDGGELNEAMVVTQLEQLVRLARDSSTRVVAAVETSAARGMGMGWIRELRREGHGLLLQPDLASDGDLLSARLPRRVSAPLVPGRGFVVQRGSVALVQVAS
jgi:S-DNA-T family DNA segregation ATPase FtsK/SpoIIIE